jgi:hypothetical protein
MMAQAVENYSPQSNVIAGTIRDFRVDLRVHPFFDIAGIEAAKQTSK